MLGTLFGARYQGAVLGVSQGALSSGEVFRCLAVPGPEIVDLEK